MEKEKDNERISPYEFITGWIAIGYFALIWYIHIYALRAYQSDPRSVYQMASDDFSWTEELLDKYTKQLVLWYSINRVDFLVNLSVYTIVFASAVFTFVVTFEIFRSAKGKFKKTRE